MVYLVQPMDGDPTDEEHGFFRRCRERGFATRNVRERADFGARAWIGSLALCLWTSAVCSGVRRIWAIFSHFASACFGSLARPGRDLLWWCCWCWCSFCC